MSKTLVSGDTRVAVNLTGRYLLVTSYKDSILGWVRHRTSSLATLAGRLQRCANTISLYSLFAMSKRTCVYMMRHSHQALHSCKFECRFCVFADWLWPVLPFLSQLHSSIHSGAVGLLQQLPSVRH